MMASQVKKEFKQLKDSFQLAQSSMITLVETLTDIDEEKVHQETDEMYIPYGYKQVRNLLGRHNLDLNGGADDKISEWLLRHSGVINFSYDKNNRSFMENTRTMSLMVLFTTATCFDVLNSIDSETERMALLDVVKDSNIRQFWATAGHANRTACSYFEEIQANFNEAEWGLSRDHDLITLRRKY